jgi:putative ABC transport system substrate-binding protein
MFTRNPGVVTAVARNSRVPAMYTNIGYVRQDGALMAYGVDLTAMYLQATSYMHRILEGERPDELPVQMPTTFSLAINVRTAEAIDLAIPPTLLARADEVIE